MDVQRACDLCSHTHFQTVSQFDRRRKPLRTVICVRCGLVSHERIPTEAELAVYYAHQYRQEYCREFVPAAYRVVREWGRGARLCRQLADDLRPADRIFEVGAGLGCTVRQLARAGYAASGIEPGDGYREFSVRQLGADIGPGVLADVPPRHQYDVVLLVHVLEHLPSPTLALAQIRNLLAPGGRVYVEVPNLAAPHAAPGKQFHFAHIYNFTAAALRMLAGKTGFVVKRSYALKRDRNLAMLLEVSSKAHLRIEAQNYVQTLAALRRYNRWTYHARPAYLCETAAKAARQFTERWQARRKLEEILRFCREDGAARHAPAAQRRAA